MSDMETLRKAVEDALKPDAKDADKAWAEWLLWIFRPPGANNPKEALDLLREQGVLP